MHHGKLATLCLIGWIAFCGHLSAGLVWKEKSLSFTPAIADVEITARYAFENTGSSTVTIKSIAPACSCVTASTSKQTVSPGERGEIVATYSIGDRSGAQATEIFIETDDVEAKIVRLKMELKIPKVAVVEPDLLRWLPGREVEPKRVRVRAEPGVQFGHVTVEPSDPSVAIRVEQGSLAGEFEVVVTPAKDHSLAGQLRIVTGFPKDHPKAILVPIQVAR